MRTKVPTEHAEQVTLVQWFRRQYPGVLIFAIPNGGKRNKVAALKLKLEGVVRGVPDLYIPAWRTWIEMKRTKGGKLSPDQAEVIEYLRGIGDTVIVAKGFDEAKAAVSSAALLH